MCESEEVASWMCQWEKEERVRQCIACPELNYPESEARYKTPEEWEKDNPKWKSWGEYLAYIV